MSPRLFVRVGGLHTLSMRSAFAAARDDGLDPAELFITSGATLTADAAPADAFRLAEVPDVAVVPGRASGEKCGRCWKVLEDVGQHQPDDLCGRCADVVAALPGATGGRWAARPCAILPCCGCAVGR